VLPSHAQREPGTPRLMKPGLVYQDVNWEGANASPFPDAWQFWVADKEAA